MRTIVAVLVLLSLLLSGCGPQTRRVETDVRMSQLFAGDFKDFRAPDVSTIKTGETKVFSNATYDEVWDAVAVVLVQDGVVIHSSKDSGVVVGLTRPPLAVHVGKARGRIPVYLYWMTDLYTSADDPEIQLVHFPDLSEKAGKFLDRVSVQLYAARKWKYLYAGQ